jgi:Flp pilus assembly protein TadG
MLFNQRRRRGRRGSVLPEFLFMLPFYATMFFGTLEFGTMFHDRIQLNNVCRMGARMTAVGNTLEEIRAGVQAYPNLGVTSAQIYIEYNDQVDGTGNWVAAANSTAGTENNVPSGYLCRVRIVDWPHRMVTGSFFSWLPNVSSGNLLMDSEQIMMHS